MRYLTSYRALALIAYAVLAIGACDSDGELNPESFVSDLPDALRDPRDGAAGDGDGDAPSFDDPARAIEEADIVQVADGRLYALSRYGGLHVIDVSDPDALERLGSFTAAHDAEPFEMYLRDGIAFVMYTDWGQYERATADDEYVWTQTSKLLVLDVSAPEAITEVASFTVPGAVSDSRIVGDVLYVVGYRDGQCWGCEQARPLTSIIALDISDPSNVSQVDELQFEDDQGSWGGSRRSIHVTSERIYVSGVEYGTDGPVGSTIQVIDIATPSGELVEAASVEAEGQITSRWQMDEHDGVLRVLSQPPAWDLQAAPVLQTFRIVSSEQLEPLGRIELDLPRPEQLQTVRFDGERAYAITFERTDPLFTIDLSDPAAPVQRGTLEMPGFVYHMVPRGDRVIGLGFDQGNAAGSITVSLFDVSDLAQPAMLSRVNFGGGWATLPEDRDRIHKAFRVLDELGLILVPHSGWQETFCGRSTSGVQLVDYDSARDALTLRGAVPVAGEARRGLVVNERLLTLSDERVESYDISDRDAPELKATTSFTRNVSRMVPLASGAVARITEDFWNTRELMVDFVSPDQVASPESGAGALSLGEILKTNGDTCDAYVWLQDSFALGDRLAVLYRSERWGGGDDGGRAGLLLIDASDPEAPELLSTTDWRFDYGFWWFDGFYDYGVPAARSAIVHTSDAIAMLEASYSDGMTTRWLRVLDVRDASQPGITVVMLPTELGQGGLLVDGDTVVTSHYEDDEGGARFFIDRIDISDPSAPALLRPINVPGTVLHFDGAARRAITADLVRVEREQRSWEECSERFATFEYEYESSADESGWCTGYRQRLHLLRAEDGGAELLDSYAIDAKQALRSSAVGSDVLFASVGTGTYRGWLAVDCWGPCGYQASEPSTLVALSNITGNAFDSSTLEIDEGAWWGWWSPAPIHAIGSHALVIGQDDALIVDATDPLHLQAVRSEPLGGYVQHVATTESDALLSLGRYGARHIEVVEGPE